MQGRWTWRWLYRWWFIWQKLQHNNAYYNYSPSDTNYKGWPQIKWWWSSMKKKRLFAALNKCFPISIFQPQAIASIEEVESVCVRGAVMGGGVEGSGDATAEVVVFLSRSLVLPLQMDTRDACEMPLLIAGFVKYVLLLGLQTGMTHCRCLCKNKNPARRTKI